MDAIALALLLSVMVERFVQLIVKPAIPLDSSHVPYVALLVGVALAVGYNVDFLRELGLTSTFPYFGAVVSGVVIGGGSNFVNDFISIVGGRSPVLLAAPIAEAEAVATVETPKAA